MKFQWSKGGGVSFFGKDGCVMFDPENLKKISKAQGIAFSYPYSETSLSVLETSPADIFAITSAGEYEVGDIYIQTRQTNKKDTIELFHIVTTEDNAQTLMCDPDACSNIPDTMTDSVDVVCIVHDKKKMSAQDLYSFALKYSPKVLIVINDDTSETAAFKKIAGSVEVVENFYTVKSKDLSQESMSVFVIT